MLLCQLDKAKQAAQDTKQQAENMQDRLSIFTDHFEREKNKTKELIRRAKDYLMGQCTGCYTVTTSLVQLKHHHSSCVLHDR